MKFSIIIPSYNQPQYIEVTIRNVLEIRKKAAVSGDVIEILLYDSVSDHEVQKILERYREQIDILKIEKDKGQYDAINKGLAALTGDYWTWLNTDDTLDEDGFQRLSDIVRKDPSIDYIYGSVDHIDEQGRITKSFPAYPLDLQRMVTHTPGIFQQGSFFRTGFTKGTGLMRPYDCCFDYEYVLRCISRGAKVYMCDFKVANFRQHAISKTGSRISVFIREQREISRTYGRKPWHFLSWFSAFRLVKHKLFPR